MVMMSKVQIVYLLHQQLHLGSVSNRNQMNPDSEQVQQQVPVQSTSQKGVAEANLHYKKQTDYYLASG